MNEAAGSTPALGAAELAGLEERIDAWAANQLAAGDNVLAVERGEADVPRWYVRVAGEAKAVYSVWFTLRQRTLAYETYFLPAPRAEPAPVYEYLLRRNGRLYGMSFGIGDEDAFYLAGAIAGHAVDDAELDRILGSIHATIEGCFTTAARLAGYGPPSPS